METAHSTKNQDTQDTEDKTEQDTDSEKKTNIKVFTLQPDLPGKNDRRLLALKMALDYSTAPDTGLTANDDANNTPDDSTEDDTGSPANNGAETENRRHNHNIALAGPYGSGKSSIIAGLKADSHYRDRIRVISLSTVSSDVSAAKEPSESTQAEATEPPSRNSRSIASSLQYSIVKQLLYGNDPSKTPKSRYLPLRATNKWTIRAISLLAALVTTIIIFLIPLTQTGLGELNTTLLRISGLNYDAKTSLDVLYGVLSVICIVVLYSLYRIPIKNSRIRFGINGFKAQSSKSDASLKINVGGVYGNTYFDKYLDEILYSFETHDDLDIVVFEDLDRFNDPEVFNNLRELNTILNNSPSVTKPKNRRGQKRDIQFIYALRDSIFPSNREQDGQAEISAWENPDSYQPGSSRTKFFDAIIPVYPFASSATSYEYLHKLIKEIDSEPENDENDKSDTVTSAIEDTTDDVIKIAALYLNDMRTFKAIATEYSIYHRKSNQENARLLAMVLYHTVYADDFEKLASRHSKLDQIYDFSRSIVEHNKCLNKEDNAIKNLMETDYKASLPNTNDECSLSEFVRKLFPPQQNQTSTLAEDLLAAGYIRDDYILYATLIQKDELKVHDQVALFIRNVILAKRAQPNFPLSLPPKNEENLSDVTNLNSFMHLDYDDPSLINNSLMDALLADMQLTKNGITCTKEDEKEKEDNIEKMLNNAVLDYAGIGSVFFAPYFGQSNTKDSQLHNEREILVHLLARINTTGRKTDSTAKQENPVFELILSLRQSEQNAKTSNPDGKIINLIKIALANKNDDIQYASVFELAEYVLQKMPNDEPNEANLNFEQNLIQLYTSHTYNLKEEDTSKQLAASGLFTITKDNMDIALWVLGADKDDISLNALLHLEDNTFSIYRTIASDFDKYAKLLDDKPKSIALNLDQQKEQDAPLLTRILDDLCQYSIDDKNLNNLKSILNENRVIRQIKNLPIALNSDLRGAVDDTSSESENSMNWLNWTEGEDWKEWTEGWKRQFKEQERQFDESTSKPADQSKDKQPNDSTLTLLNVLIDGSNTDRQPMIAPSWVNLAEYCLELKSSPSFDATNLSIDELSTYLNRFSKLSGEDIEIPEGENAISFSIDTIKTTLDDTLYHLLDHLLNISGDNLQKVKDRRKKMKENSMHDS